MNYLGNQDILNSSKTGFLCSRKCPADVVLRSYDWAKKHREEGHCVVCGNHSQIERDVFDILLKGNQPLILVLTRGLKTRWEKPIVKAVREKRLLVVSPFSEGVRRASRKTAEMKNKTIIELSDGVVVGYKTPGGQLSRLLLDVQHIELVPSS